MRERNWLTGFVVHAPVGGKHDDVDEMNDAGDADAGLR